MLLAILLPLAGGAILPLCRFKTRHALHGAVLAVLVLEAAAVTALLFSAPSELTLLRMTDALVLALKMDGISRLFLAIAAYGYLLSAIYAFRYLEHGGRETSFFSFFLLSLGALAGMDLAKNLITLYLCFELLTLLSMPLVLHDRTQASIRAALKYLFYSVAGAFLGLCAIFFLAQYATTLDFQTGGALDPARFAGHEGQLRVVIFLGVLGFGAKAGLYPLHGWLPTAHPVAPAPASAILSGIIAKAGVLAILRLIYFSVGPNFFAGTWVQTAWLSLALLTVFMGSMMAYREKVLKKRLAYSTVSQISYVLTGLFLLTPEGMVGGLLHVVFHATIKLCLFMAAGSIIFNTGKTRVDELRGYGKLMPITFWSYTAASLALIGIPPASGFVSKWYLASGALNSGLPVFSWLAPVILLISALLTAGYLLPISIDGFFPGRDFQTPDKRSPEGGWIMWGPIVLLSALTMLLGLFSAPLVSAVRALAATLF